MRSNITMSAKANSISRRSFMKTGIGGTILASAASNMSCQESSSKLSLTQVNESKVEPSSQKAEITSPLKNLRMGGPVKAVDPESWIQELKQRGYRAAYCPVDAKASDDIVNAYAKAAKANDIVIAEVGAWSNPMSPDEKARQQAIRHCKGQLALAERIGANCCVNISGSRGKKWDGHDEKNLTQETFDMIVEVTRNIIDEVNPGRTYFTLEPMPWMYPDSPNSYLRLIKAIDRQHFGAHLDPVNMICSPQLYYGNAKFIQECFEKLGPYLKSCHGKDIILEQKLTTHLNEIRPGLGGLDYRTYLRELSKLGNMPLMLEHLETDEEYILAARHIRAVAGSIGLEFGQA